MVIKKEGSIFLYRRSSVSDNDFVEEALTCFILAIVSSLRSINRLFGSCIRTLHSYLIASRFCFPSSIRSTYPFHACTTVKFSIQCFGVKSAVIIFGLTVITENCATYAQRMSRHVSD
ncbi:uncharacterized protein PHALS_15169 [Plasmopara halstedii]|uniref:Uncharacterized protein n=1 Tax=Plasmopara halstedii TaxID=4781 RepID=A0A0P1B428_PLAHL|nr:uncharacterized protein PHALS_15169 [Plasmopara halstedii]CEG48750.1 hypothetical protein PHALS_15169 [Plasmopara halstedii]|eukprot:XP_024585119.1 hypothetical protein PHALS_15169 [Plasmopara halstedii]